MKTLEEHNKERMDAFMREHGEVFGAIDVSCPKCEGPLFADRSQYLASMPPKVNVRCPNCNYQGYAIA